MTRACAKRRKPSYVHDMEDDFALRYVRIYPGVNSRAELVTLAPGLRPERRFAPLARGLPLTPHSATYNDSRTSFMEKIWMSYLSTKHGLMKTSVTQRSYTPTTPSSGKIEQEEMVAVSWLESKQVRSVRSRNSLQTWMA